MRARYEMSGLSGLSSQLPSSSSLAPSCCSRLCSGTGECHSGTWGREPYAVGRIDPATYNMEVTAGRGVIKFMPKTGDARLPRPPTAPLAHAVPVSQWACIAQRAASLVFRGEMRRACGMRTTPHQPIFTQRRTLRVYHRELLVLVRAGR